MLHEYDAIEYMHIAEDIQTVEGVHWQMRIAKNSQPHILRLGENLREINPPELSFEYQALWS